MNNHRENICILKKNKKKKPKKTKVRQMKANLLSFFSVNYPTSRFPPDANRIMSASFPVPDRQSTCLGSDSWNSRFSLHFIPSSFKIPCLIMDGFTEALNDEPKVPRKRNRPGSPDSSHSRSSSLSKNSLQDRLFTKYVWNAFLPG